MWQCSDSISSAKGLFSKLSTNVDEANTFKKHGGIPAPDLFTFKEMTLNLQPKSFCKWT
jgi:hypothetical protein